MISGSSSGTRRMANRSESSCTAPVGRPPDQKKASSRSSISLAGIVSIPAETGVMSPAGSTPAAVISRSATRRTPDPFWPTPTRLPRRSATFWIFEPLGTISWT